jgi:hypothetical protein
MSLQADAPLVLLRRFFLPLVMLAAIALVTGPFAGTAYSAAKPIEVQLNEKVLSFPQAPIAENGTTLVPFRAIFEAMGLKVEWNAQQQTVSGSKTGLSIVMTLNKKTAVVNGKTVNLPQPPQIRNNATLVPLRFIGEASGALVFWNPYKPQVLIYTEDHLAKLGVTKTQALADLNKQLAEIKRKLDEEAASKPPVTPTKPVVVPEPTKGNAGYKPAGSGAVDLSRLQGMYYGFSPDYDGSECGGMCWNIITFLPGQKVMIDAPASGGPETLNTAAAQSYQIQGGKLVLASGKSRSIAVKGGKLYVDEVELAPVKPVANNLKLSGEYTHMGFSGLIGISAGSSSWTERITFNSNGTFTSSNFMIGNVQGGDPTSGAAGSDATGSYKISGNTIVMVTTSGNKSQALFFVHDDGDIQIGDKSFSPE